MDSNFSFGADPEYQDNYRAYYDSLTYLISKRAKINKSTVADQAGRGRSAIKPSRPEFAQLISDIEAAYRYVCNDPDAQAIEKLKAQKTTYKEEAKLWKERYSNLLVVNITLLGEVDRLTAQTQVNSELQAENCRLRQENSKILRSISQTGIGPKLVE